MAADRSKEGTRPGLPAGAAALVPVLTAVTALSALIIVVTFRLTEPTVNANRVAAVRSAVLAVLPGSVRVGGYAVGADGLHRLASAAAGGAFGSTVYAGYDHAGRLLGVAVEATGQGYQDVIRMLYAYHLGDRAIVGMMILESKETPGLGDRIGVDPTFLAQFRPLPLPLDATGAVLERPVELARTGRSRQTGQIDGISGATVSSKAVGRMLTDSLAARLPLLAAAEKQLREDVGG